MAAQREPASSLIHLGLLLTAALFPAHATAQPAPAYLAPPIAGHVTDPRKTLSREEKAALESLFGALQADTRIDTAAFIADVAPREIDDAGRAAFEQWGIGRAWKGGVLIVLSADGQAARVVESPGEPALTPAQVAAIETAVLSSAQRGDLATALRTAAERVGDVLRPLSKIPRVPPPAAHDPRRGGRYGAATLALVALALHLSHRRRPAWKPR